MQVTGTPPVLTLPGDITVSTDPGAATATVNYTVTATDAEDGDLSAAVGLVPPSGSSFGIGETTVVATLTDSGGNTVQGTFTVSVSDDEPPVITAPAQVSRSAGAGSAFATVDVATIGAVSDNVPGVSPLVYKVAGVEVSGQYQFPIGTTQLDLSATDAAGNAAQASVAVIVTDSENPVLAALPNISQPLDSGMTTALVTMIAAASDNSGAQIAPSYAVGGVQISNPHAFAEGTHVVKVTAEDPSGKIATGQFDVTVYPGQPLQLASRLFGRSVLPGRPATYELTLDNPNGVDITNAIIAVALGSSTGGPVAPSGMGLTYVGVTGGCTGTIAAAPPGGLGLTGANVTIPANGSCTITGQVSVDATTPIGSVPVLGLTDFDNAGGSFLKLFEPLAPILVGVPPDFVPPVLSVPADVSVSTDPGRPTANVSFAVSAWDDVDGDLDGSVVLSHPSGGSFPIGVTTVTASVADAAGNLAQDSFTIAVTDDEAPVITPPSDIVVAPAPGATTASLNVIGLGAVADNSGEVPAITYAVEGVVLTGARDFPSGKTTVTMDAQDSAGNDAAQASFTVTVEDRDRPTIAVTADRSRLGNGETATIHFILSEAATDFELSDIDTTAGTLDGFTGAGTSYSAVFTPAADAVGTAVVSVADGRFTDAAGNSNADGAEADNRVTIQFDRASPSASIAALGGPVAGVYTAQITLSGASTDFTAVDLDLVNASATLAGSGRDYTATLTPIGDGLISITVRAASFSDGFGNSNAAASNTVGATHDTTGPRAEILDAPDSFAAQASFEIRIVFTEPVTGFDVSDLSLTNAEASGFTGMGTTYHVDLRPSGAGDVTVQVPADVAFDGAGNGNEAAVPVQVGNRTVNETQAQIAGFMSVRANHLVSSQPDLSCHFGNRCGGGRFDAQATQGALSFDLATRQDWPVWFALSASRSTVGATESDLVFGAIGSHRQVSDTLMIGFLFELDHVSQADAGTRIEGTGWMAGPYLVGKLPDQPLYYEARLLGGVSHNNVTPFGSFTDSFTTRRMLAQVAVSGRLEYGETILTPRLAGSYTTDLQRAYTNGLGNPVPEQDIALGQLELGMDFETPVALFGQDWTIGGGVSGIYSSVSGSGGAQNTVTPYEGGRGRVELSARTILRHGGVFRLGASYDGLGATDFEALGLDLGLDWEF